MFGRHTQRSLVLSASHQLQALLVNLLVLSRSPLSPAAVMSVSCPSHVSDCTKVLQGSLDAMGDCGGGEVVVQQRDMNHSGWPLQPLSWTISDQPSNAKCKGSGLCLTARHSNVQLTVLSGVVLEATRGTFKPVDASLIRIENVSNFTIRGGTFRMWRADYNNTVRYHISESRHGIALSGDCRNVSLLGVTVSDTGGDGLMIGPSDPILPNGLFPQPADTLVQDCVFERNHRQGLSVIGTINLIVRRTTFSDTGNHALGTDPMAGVDIEPSRSGLLRNITFESCTSVRNTGAGWAVYLADYNRSNGPINITLTNCSVVGTGTTRPVVGRGRESQTGFSFGAIYAGIAGDIAVRDCQVRSTRMAGISIASKQLHSVRLQITGMTLTNVARASMPCDGDFGCIAKGAMPAGAVSSPVSMLWRQNVAAQGGVTFQDLTVVDHVRRPWLQMIANPSGSWTDVQVNGSVFNEHGCVEAMNGTRSKIQVEVSCVR